MKRLFSCLLVLIFLFSLLSCHTWNVDSSETTQLGAESGENPPEDIPEPFDEPEISSPHNIRINELMANNNDFVLRCYDDWVELFNLEDESVVLDGYYLTDGGKESQWIDLSGRTIEAGGYLTILLDSDNSFKLSQNGETVSLIYGAELVDSLTYDSSLGTSSYSHEGIEAYPTPGFVNSKEGYEAYLESLPYTSLMINEVVSSNSRWEHSNGKTYDFVELKNTSGRILQLSDFYLSDKRSEPQKYRLPNVTLMPDDFYLVWCSGEEDNTGAPFKISAGGETLVLSTISGVVDQVKVPGDLMKNESWGRVGKQFVYFKEVTPGLPNSEGYPFGMKVPEASRPSGLYDYPQDIVLSGEGTIYYTLDGSQPDRKSNVYSAPIHVDNIVTIRTFCVSGTRESEEKDFTYIIGKNHSYPIISIVTKPEYLSGETGVLNHITPEYEHPVFLTMIEDGQVAFSLPCGFKLHGNDSKKMPKQNFQLRFRSQYGQGTLHYPVFPDLDITSFNSLLLKGGSEDCLFTGFRDEFCTSLVAGSTHLYTQAYRPVVLYLNGDYWGIYWLRERFDAEYVAQHLNVSRESVNALHTYGSIQSGSNKEYNDLINYCKNHDLTKEEYYRHVIDQIDVYSLMDWYICRSYMGDRDLANIRYFMSKEADGKWHWCYFDLDWAFWNNYEDSMNETIRKDGHHVLILSLLKNPEFKDLFLRRYADLMNSILNEESLQNHLDLFISYMEPELEANMSRWGISRSSWDKAIARLNNTFRNGARDANILPSIQNFFHLSQEEMIQYFGRIR